MNVCRHCDSTLEHSFCDLGVSPLANSYLDAEDLGRMEPFYPLHAWVCQRCFLVQLGSFETPEHIFGHYAYFSSYSDSWLAHARSYVDAMIARFGFGSGSQVIEVASNDGYLLQFFVARGVPVLGIEPARNVAAVASERGIPTRVAFFGKQEAERLRAEDRQADLLIGNNVLAHVPDLGDFVQGLKTLLAPAGVLTMEFPHLLELMRQGQFDTIYHEHFSYFSLLSVQRIFSSHGLAVFDVERLPTHGGSLRIYATHAEGTTHAVSDAVQRVANEERAAGLASLDTYLTFSDRARHVKRSLLRFLLEAKEGGRTVAAYGAPAKGNTLLNFCGVRTDLVEFTVDRSPHKQGRYLPGSRIPIHPPEHVAARRPDYLLVLPWNLKEEIMTQMAFIRDWGGRFVVPIPDTQVLA